MKRRVFLSGALAAGTLSAACAPTPYANPLGREARAALRFARIEVNTAGTAYESARAADYASGLGPQLQARLRRAFSDRLDPGGVTLAVEIQRLNVAGATGTAFGRDQSRMSGAARVLDREGTLLASYPITVIAGQARSSTVGALASAAVTTADGYYRALLDEFAQNTRIEILGSESFGARTVRQLTGG